MERFVVERGVNTQLLTVINNPIWPPSLREIAGGCLEFFTERYTNLAHFPDMALPEGMEWPLEGAPHQGIVPYISSMVFLVNSRVPLLEYRGCHGLARICYAAPYACPQPKEFLRQAKAGMAMLGGLDVIFMLAKRQNKRYQVRAGRRGACATR